MQFRVYRRRREGRERMRHEWGNDTFIGHLQIKEAIHPDLHRLCRVACIVDSNLQPLPDLPPLHDAMLVSVHRGYWVLTGFERIESGYSNLIDYAQTWTMSPLDEV